jgi:hypothetical protein
MQNRLLDGELVGPGPPRLPGGGGGGGAAAREAMLIVCLLLARRGLLYRGVCDELAKSLVCVERLNRQASALRHG